MKNSDTFYRIRIVLLTWRRIRDSNSSGTCIPYRFSRPTPSTTWVILHLVDQEDHDTPTIRLWAEGSSFELLVRFFK